MSLIMLLCSIYLRSTPYVLILTMISNLLYILFTNHSQYSVAPSGAPVYRLPSSTAIPYTVPTTVHVLWSLLHTRVYPVLPPSTKLRTESCSSQHYCFTARKSSTICTCACARGELFLLAPSAKLLSRQAAAMGDQLCIKSSWMPTRFHCGHHSILGMYHYHLHLTLPHITSLQLTSTHLHQPWKKNNNARGVLCHLAMITAFTNGEQMCGVNSQNTRESSSKNSTLIHKCISPVVISRHITEYFWG